MVHRPAAKVGGIGTKLKRNQLEWKALRRESPWGGKGESLRWGVRDGAVGRGLVSKETSETIGLE